jgi:hypothetical protein
MRVSAGTKLVMDVRSLLDLLPGLRTTGFTREQASAEVAIEVTSREGMLALQSECQGANVRLLPWVKVGAEQYPIDCTIHASTRALDGLLRFGYLQALAIQLVWRLHRLGLLSAGSANSKLKKWNGASIGTRGGSS